MKKFEQLEPFTRLKVVKDIYIIPKNRDNSCEAEGLTYEELMNSVIKILVKDDIYEVWVDYDDVEYEDGFFKYIHCIEGSWEGESNDGWFEVDEMIEKGALEILS